LKYWLEVIPDENSPLESRIADGLKIWKLSPMDIESYGALWYDYSRYQGRNVARNLYGLVGAGGTWLSQTTEASGA